MSKKNFKSGFDLILGEEIKKDFTKETEENIYTENSVENIKIYKTDRKLKTTLRIKEDLINQAKDYAHWNRKSLTELFELAIENYINANPLKKSEGI
jgi:hypothetical protein